MGRILEILRILPQALLLFLFMYVKVFFCRLRTNLQILSICVHKKTNNTIHIKFNGKK